MAPDLLCYTCGDVSSMVTHTDPSWYCTLNPNRQITKMTFGRWWHSTGLHCLQNQTTPLYKRTNMSLRNTFLERVSAEFQGIHPWRATTCHLQSKWKTCTTTWSCRRLVMSTTVMAIAIFQSRITWHPPHMLLSGHCGGKEMILIQIHPRDHTVFHLS